MVSSGGGEYRNEDKGRGCFVEMLGFLRSGRPAVPTRMRVGGKMPMLGGVDPGRRSCVRPQQDPSEGSCPKTEPVTMPENRERAASFDASVGL
jgi:hypothetical protein